MNRKTNFIRLISDNVESINKFILDKIPNTEATNSIYKIIMNCPYCPPNKKKKKLVINLDWANFHCFRCGESGSIIKLFKYYNINEEFKTFLYDVYGVSHYNILEMFKSNYVVNTVCNNKDELEVNKQSIKTFIDKHGLMHINKLKNAKKYALSRVYNDALEVESYLADEKYIYIPIIMNSAIVYYMARLYLDMDLPRYIMHNVCDDSTVSPIGFFDEVTDNFSTNSVYITEGYFDSYAINYTFSNYVSICAFGKTKVSAVTELLKNKLPADTNIYLTLDSPKKDKAIYKSIIHLGKEIHHIFPNIYVIELADGDPAEVLSKNGSLYLRNQLTINKTPFLKYLVLNSNK